MGRLKNHFLGVVSKEGPYTADTLYGLHGRRYWQKCQWASNRVASSPGKRRYRRSWYWDVPFRFPNKSGPDATHPLVSAKSRGHESPHMALLFCECAGHVFVAQGHVGDCHLGSVRIEMTREGKRLGAIDVLR